MNKTIIEGIEIALGNVSGISATQISKSTKLSLVDVKQALLFLIKENKIIRHGKAKGTKYYLIGAQAALEESSTEETQEQNDWVPKVGDRITIIYPPGWSVSIPPKRRGIVVEMQCDGPPGSFVVFTNPDGYRMFVDPENCAKHGVTFRKWQFKDGWIMDEKPKEPKEKKKKKGMKNDTE